MRLKTTEQGATPSHQLFGCFNAFFSSTWRKTRVEQLSLKVFHIWCILGHPIARYILILLFPFPEQNVIRNLWWVLLLTENHIQKRFMATIIPGRKKCVLHVSIVVVLNDPNHVISILHHRRLSRPNLKIHTIYWLDSMSLWKQKRQLSCALVFESYLLFWEVFRWSKTDHAHCAKDSTLDVLAEFLG